MHQLLDLNGVPDKLIFLVLIKMEPFSYLRCRRTCRFLNDLSQSHNALIQRARPCAVLGSVRWKLSIQLHDNQIDLNMTGEIYSRLEHQYERETWHPYTSVTVKTFPRRISSINYYSVALKMFGTDREAALLRLESMLDVPLQTWELLSFLPGDMMLQLLKKGLIVYKDMTYGTSNSMNVFTLHMVDVNCNSIGENSFRPYEFIEPLLPLTKRQGTADLAEQQLLGYLGGLIDNHRTDTPREIAITCEKTETAPKTPNCLRLLWTSEEEYIQWRNLRNAASGETELERVTLLYTRVSNVYLLYLLVEFQDNTIFRKVTTFRKYGAFLKGALKELQYPEDSPTAATEAFDGILIALRQVPN